jgi:hypothetical protein
LLPVAGLLVGALICVSSVAVERARAGPITLNARLCVERQFAGTLTFSIGAYYRAGAGPLPAPMLTSYRACMFVPWASNLPGQAAIVLPPWGRIR